MLSKKSPSTFASVAPNWLIIINWTYKLAGESRILDGWQRCTAMAVKLRPAGVIKLGVSPIAKKVFREVL
ncbi:hypothetical protein [Paenibacillus anseongensis]|uniref:hypothetical protein n=1 Tax=Paenibacillus sp. CGMCC 1.16610 TaxID=2755557 RepID=UPI0015EF9C0F|nr:hypothetical protein [Paenibacillus sp. CGMCC 1.16610]